MSRPKTARVGEVAAISTKVPDPARRSTMPASCRSRTARPTVIREPSKRALELGLARQAIAGLEPAATDLPLQRVE